MSDTTKACPWCGETILAVARKCKHCGEFLDDPLPQITGRPASEMHLPPTPDWDDEDDYRSPKGHYRPAAFQRVYGWFVTLFGSSCLFLSLALVFGLAAGWEQLRGEGVFSSGAGSRDYGALDRAALFGLLALSWLLIGSFFALPSAVPFLVLIYRCWRLIQDGRARTTPGKAIGLLFVPCFNYYWIFVAIRGLAVGLESYAHRHQIVIRPPATGAALAYCILTLCGSIPFIGLLLLIPQVILLVRVVRSLKDSASDIAQAEGQGETPPPLKQGWRRVFLKQGWRRIFLRAGSIGVVSSALIVWWNWPRQPVLILDPQDRGSQHVVFPSEKNRLITASSSGTVCVWDITPELGDQIRLRPTFTFQSASEYSRVALSGNGQRVAIAARNPSDRINLVPAEIKVSEVTTGRQLWLFREPRGVISNLALSPDGAFLASATQEHDHLININSPPRNIKVWDLTTGQTVNAFRGGGRSTHNLLFSPDGKKLALVSDESTIRIWDTHTGKELLVHQMGGGHIYNMDFSPDGTLLATSSVFGGVKVCDAAKGLTVHTLEMQGDSIFQVCFSSEGRFLAGSNIYEDRVRVWDLTTGKVAFSVRGTDATFSPDGKWMTTIRGGQIHLWDLPSLLAHPR